MFEVNDALDDAKVDVERLEAGDESNSIMGIGRFLPAVVDVDEKAAATEAVDPRAFAKPSAGRVGADKAREVANLPVPFVEDNESLTRSCVRTISSRIAYSASVI